jgi:hypothetical protein
MKHLLGVVLLFGILPPLQSAERPPLLPRPQQIQYGTGQVLVRGLSIRLPEGASAEDRFAASVLSGCLSLRAGSPVAILEKSNAQPAIVFKRTGAVAALPAPGEPAGPESREAYWIKAKNNQVELRAVSSAGLYYAAQTACQMVEGSGAQAALPEVEIHDWPSLSYRGVMMDTSHGPLPKEVEVMRQLDFLARWKNNQYYLYSEASVALDGFPILNPEAQFSKDAIRRIVAYARQRHIDVVPCMELYGHLHDLFRIERYADLSLLPHGSDFDPRNPRVAEVLGRWIGQLADLFPSPFFHIGFDETEEAPHLAGSDKALPATLYMQQFRMVSGLIGQHNRTLLVWSDMFARYPDLIPQIPPGTIIVPWGYDRTVYEPYWKPFENSTLPRIVATGVSVWDQIAPNFDRSFDNIDAFLSAGRRHGVIGLMNTIWTDDIAVLTRPAFPGMAYGAVAAWQTNPVNRSTFFLEYAQVMYGKPAAAEVAAGLEAADKAERALARAIGGGHPEWEETSPAFWDDPLTKAHLERAQQQRPNFHEGRLEAEDAIEHLSRALARGADPSTLSDLLLEARLLDYAGMKNVYAAEMEGFWQGLGAHPEPTELGFYIGKLTSHDHSQIEDLLDASGDLGRAYGEAWLGSYTPYRLGTVMGRWTEEFLYWRRLQRRLRDFEDSYHKGDTLPPLESFSPGY